MNNSEQPKMNRIFKTSKVSIFFLQYFYITNIYPMAKTNTKIVFLIDLIEKKIFVYHKSIVRKKKFQYIL